jgi:hypothetical protein
LAIDEAKANLPEQVRNNILIKRVDFKDIPVYTFTII